MRNPEKINATRRSVLAAGVALPWTMGRNATSAEVVPAATRPPTTPSMPAPTATLDIVRRSIDPLELGPATTFEGQLAGGKLPGAELRFREGDIFRVLVNNRLFEPTTLHWHGIIPPNLQDGVPGITQAPIPPGGSILYEFPLLQTGTYWYHSHFGLQEQLGLAGPLVIEERADPYDAAHDEVLMLFDWIAGSPDGVIPAIRSGVERPGFPASMDFPSSPSHTLDGRPWNVDVYPPGLLANGRPAKDPGVLKATVGRPTRIRIINAGPSTFFTVRLAELGMTLVEADSNPVAPLPTDRILLGPGERCDVLVTPKREGAWTIEAAGLGLPFVARAVLATDGADPSSARPVVGAPGRATTVEDLRATFDTRPPEGPVRTFDLPLGGNMKDYLWSIGGEYFAEDYVPEPNATPLDVEAGSRVRITMRNPTKMAHPMHLHGHFFRVRTRGRSWDDVDLPLKDTLTVLPGDTAEIEFFCDNPGNWFFHCHNIYHLATGMARVVSYRVPLSTPAERGGR